MSVTTPPASRSAATTGHDKSGARARVGRLYRSTRRLTSDWLDRPMTSLHLIMAIFALLLGFGLLMVLSSSSVTAFRYAGSSFSVFANQATYAAVGLVAFCATQLLPVRLMRSLSTTAVIVSLALLVAVLIPGVGALVFGARSWIRIGGFQFQPSEIAKLALLLWMGHVLAARRSTLGSAKALLIPVLPVFGLMVLLIMRQPDLGTTVALTIVFMAVLYFAGAPWWIFASVGAVGVAGLTALAFSAPYRLARLVSFVNPESDAAGSYQLLQSLYGLGNGGWFGVGLGQSRAKWSYLPNADSDFIFAIIGEELGLIGAGVLLLLFALLAYTGLRIARRNVDPFVKIVASAATVWLVGQAAINIGYVVGLLPVTGIPLPMISAGGTSLLITMVVFGLLANFARREPQAAAALQASGGSRLAQFLGIRPADHSRPRSESRRRRRGSAAIAAAAPVSGRGAPQPVAEQHAQPQHARAADPRGRRTADPRPARIGPRSSAADLRSSVTDSRATRRPVVDTGKPPSRTGSQPAPRDRPGRPGTQRDPAQRYETQRDLTQRGATPPRTGEPRGGDPRGRSGRRDGR